MLNLLLCIITFFIPLTVFSQEASIVIKNVDTQNYCTGNELSVNVALSGNFLTNNQFSVRVKYNIHDTSPIFVYPAQLVGDKIITNLKDSVLATSPTLVMQVVASNPAISSNWSNIFQVHSKATLKFTSVTGQNTVMLNSTDPIKFTLTSVPASRGGFTLNNGDKFEMYYGQYPNGSQQVYTLPNTRPGTYFIKEANSECGISSHSGQMTVKVNSVDIFPVYANPAILCEDTELKIGFSSNGYEFPPTTNFKIRFYSESQHLQAKEIEVPAVMTEKGILTARFPTGFNLISPNAFFIGIVVDNPSLSVKNTNYKIYVYPKMDASLRTSNSTINVGEQTYIGLNSDKISDYTATLSNGVSSISSWTVAPTETTTYRIQSISSACGDQNNPSQQPLTITVRPSVSLASPETGGTQTFCEGQVARIRFKAVGMTPQTTYNIETSGYSNSDIFVFPAKVVGEFLEFLIPVNEPTNLERDYGNIRGFRIVTNAPALTSPFNENFRIKSKPAVFLSGSSATNVSHPSLMRVEYLLFGGRPFTVEYIDGRKEIIDSRNNYQPLFLKNDTTFQFTSISNQCFVNTTPAAFPLTVTNPLSPTPSLYIELIEKDYCVGDSVEVEVFYTGNFQAGNEFTLSSHGDYAQFNSQKITKPGKYKVKFPFAESPYRGFVTVSSSSPRLDSETLRHNLTAQPTSTSIHPSGTKENPISLPYNYGNPNSITVRSSPETTINYSINGTAGSTVTTTNGEASVNFVFPFDRQSEFKIHSATNTCGTYLQETVSYFKRPAYSIRFSTFSIGNEFCTGSSSEFYFRTFEGSPNSGTKFTLQIGTQDWNSTFTDVATITGGSRFKIQIPDLPAGNYALRIFSSDNIYSENLNIRIGNPPTSILQLHNALVKDTTLFVEYGTQIFLNSYFTGSSPWNLEYSDGKQERNISSSYSSYSPIITKPEHYYITKTMNPCGYGSTRGSVDVKIKPTLVFKKHPENSAAVLCPGQEVQVSYVLGGIETLEEYYLIFSIIDQNQQIIKLDSTKSLSGIIGLKIPENFTGNYFRIQASLPSYQLQQTIAYQGYVTPDITLVGDITIWRNQSATLFVHANSSFASNTSFELSDGSTHVFSSGSKGQIKRIEVTPRTTTTYTIKEMRTNCGVGKTSGSATITVEDRKDNALSIVSLNYAKKSSICNSDTVPIDFYPQGVISPNIRYTVFLSDSLGKNFREIPSFGNQSPVRAIIPSDLPPSAFYRLRLACSDPEVNATTYPELLNIGRYSTIKVLTPELYYKEGQPVQLKVNVTGSFPIYYHYGDNNISVYRTVNTLIDSLLITPISPVASYRILDVTNTCGPGRIGDPSTFKIELITANENPLTGSESVKIGPNPTSDYLQLGFQYPAIRDLSLFTMEGKQVYSEKVRENSTQIYMREFSSGIYLLHIKNKDKTTTYRIIKY